MTPKAFADAVFELYLEDSLSFIQMLEFLPPELDRRYWPALQTLKVDRNQPCDWIERFEEQARFLEQRGQKTRRLRNFIRLLHSRHDCRAIATL